MIEFVGTLEGTLDKKGRCSIPSEYRRQLNGQQVYLRRSLRGPMLEAWPAEDFANNSAPRPGPNDVPSDDEDDLAYMLIGDVVPAQPDADGRITVPPELLAHAGLEGPLAFVGRRSFFEIWSRPAFAERRARALAALRAQRGGA